MIADRCSAVQGWLLAAPVAKGLTRPLSVDSKGVFKPEEVLILSEQERAKDPSGVRISVQR